jgi:preprotein translocase subunit SecD
MLANHSHPRRIGQTSRSVSRRGAFLTFAATFFVATAAFAGPLALELESAGTGFDERTGKPLLKLKLKESSKRVFAIFSNNNIGRKIELRADGKVLSSAFIREPLLGGLFQISGMSLEKAHALAEELSRPGIKVEVDDASD